MVGGKSTGHPRARRSFRLAGSFGEHWLMVKVVRAFGSPSTDVRRGACVGAPSYFRIGISA